ETVCAHYGIDPYQPIREIPEDKLDIILYGTKEKIEFSLVSNSGRRHEKRVKFEGIIENLNRRYIETTSDWIRKWIESFMSESTCPVCKGHRLNEAALSVKIKKLNISEMMDKPVEELKDLIFNLDLNNEQQQISKLLLEEIGYRLIFLDDVGLGYLNLARGAATLSGGEAQRIRLATQIGSKLSGVLYVLDEQSIGLHQKDNERLINSLKKMR